MDREKLFRYLEQKYTSKRDMLSRIPLGLPPEGLWHELMNRRRSKSTILPLNNYKGLPYWYVTTEKMVAASEKIVEALLDNETDMDPYENAIPVSTLEEVFYTSYVEGAQISIQNAMEFLAGDSPPRDIEEQLIMNNRQAAGYATDNLFRPIETEYLKELIYFLTDGIDGGGQDLRSIDDVDMTYISDETFPFPSARSIPGRLEELSAFIERTPTHPLIKAAVAQAYIMTLRPFPEGNERLGRLISSVILLRSGYTFFSDISLSALIARRNYGYYEAMANILRDENECDMTYFIEYFLDLLSRAVDERQLRLSQREEQTRQAERQLAHTSLSISEQPAETLPSKHEVKGGDFLDGFVPVSINEEMPQSDKPKDSTEVTRLKNMLLKRRGKENTLIKKSIDYIIRSIEQGKSLFTSNDFEVELTLSKKQTTNLMGHLRQYNIIEALDEKDGRYTLYGVAADIPTLTEKDYSEDIIDTINELRFVSKSPRDNKLGEIIFKCLPDGYLNIEDHFDNKERASLGNKLKLCERMGLLTKIQPYAYRINRKNSVKIPDLTENQRLCLTLLYKHFNTSNFTHGDASNVLPVGKSNVTSNLHDLCLLKLLRYEQTEKNYLYHLAVTPDEQPSLFCEPKESDTAVTSSTTGSERSKAYSDEIYQIIETLADSATSLRDRRVGDTMVRCLDKGTLNRSDYYDWGYTESMWLSDTSLAAQLGLITKKDIGKYVLNHKLTLKRPPLKQQQKKTVTQIYEAFGDKKFSHEMFIATLNYSVSYTYASLHKLTLLHILKQSSSEDGSRYQLIVNPEDHPECFDVVA